MKKTHIFPFLVLTALTLGSQAATVIEDWQFEETGGTQFTGLTNSAPAPHGGASWTSNKAQVATDGAGSLEFTQGADGGDNVFRNSTLTFPDVTTGVYEMDWTYVSATIAGGDATGANVGFGMRDAAGTDLFIVRLQRQNSALRLQHRVGTTNTNLQNFGTNSISDLYVRVSADFDADTFDVYWKLGGGAEQSSLGNAMAGTGLEFDEVRMAANTNTTDWGATDAVTVSNLTVAFIPEPATLSLLSLVGLTALLRRRR